MSFNSRPFISILLATYNGERFLKQQLDSIFNQTYDNFELVISDDCSNDGTLDLLKRYKTKYKNKIKISITQNKKNLGYKNNFALLLQQAKGDLIALCDQDDIWHHKKLELLSRHIDGYSLIYSDSRLIDSEAKPLNSNLSNKLNNNFNDFNSCLNFLFDNAVSAHAMLFKKDLLHLILPLPEYIYFDAWIASIAASLNGVKYYKQPLVEYRQHSSNTLSRKKKKKYSLLSKIHTKYEKKFNDRKLMIQKVLEFKRNKALKQQEDKLLNSILNYYNSFENSWFNYKMFFFLLKNRNIFFQITKKNKFILCFKQSIGSKLYRMVPFL